MTLWWTETTEHGEVLVYRAGALIHKKWPDGTSVAFGAVPSFAYHHRSPDEESARRVIGVRVTTDEDVARMHAELAKRPF